jgi:hypothetical protein
MANSLVLQYCNCARRRHSLVFLIAYAPASLSENRSLAPRTYLLCRDDYIAKNVLTHVQILRFLYRLKPKEPNSDTRLIEEHQIVGDSSSLLLNSDRGESDPGYYGPQSEVNPNEELTA